mmetsp:Transcript_13683/g.42840  ORF Transcript_13683/g.42840 Transcript_13683/m.42840 type:complete len:80 (-) Transcript_13683:103-342(-)
MRMSVTLKTTGAIMLQACSPPAAPKPPSVGRQDLRGHRDACYSMFNYLQCCRKQLRWCFQTPRFGCQLLGSRQMRCATP